MSLPPAVDALVHRNADFLVAVLLVIAFVGLPLVIWLLCRSAELTRVYRRLTRGTSGGNLEEVLTEHMRTVGDVARRIGDLEVRVGQLAEAHRHCLQHVAVVRFDAFEDVGGEQSFAVAVTDATGTGVVISSVFSRTDVRVYAKALKDRRPSHSLSAEEQKAIAHAEGTT